MAAELQDWVEGSEVVKKVQKEPLVVTPEAVNGNSSGTTNGSVAGATGGGEPALSVISDTFSDSDSGKGGSDTTVTEQVVATPPWMYAPYNACTAYSKTLGSMMPNHLFIYEFHIPQQLVGKLIGRKGMYIRQIQSSTGACIVIRGSGRTKICVIEGTCGQIDQALQQIRERFPEKRFNQMTLEQVNMPHAIPASNISFIPNNRLNLVEGVVNDVTISCVIDLDHIFVQQPTHPTFPCLSRLHEALNALYEQPNGAPPLAQPFNPGVICVTKIGKDNWVRAEVIALHNENLATVKLVDVGGYIQVPVDELRMIRADFVSIPFQVTECRLANVAPVNEKEGWSEEAINFFKIISQGHILQAHVVGYNSTDGTTLVNFYKLTGVSNPNHVLINEEMVTHNYAKWIDEVDQQYYYTDGVNVYSTEMNQLSQNFGEWVPFSPAMMTVLPTEAENYGAGVPTTPASVETHTFSTDNASSDVIPEEDLTLASTMSTSWADEMSAYEEANNEDLTVTEDVEKVRRKKSEDGSF